MKRILLAIALMITIITTFAQIPVNGLEAWYPLGDTTGVAIDSSGNNNHATVIGLDTPYNFCVGSPWNQWQNASWTNTNPTATDPPVVAGYNNLPNSAYQFYLMPLGTFGDGPYDTNNRVVIPPVIQQGNSSFSVAVWFKQESWMPPQNFPIVTLGGVNDTTNYFNLIYIGLHADGGTGGGYTNMSLHGRAGNYTFATPFALTYGWHMVCMTYDSAVPEIRVYLDKVLIKKSNWSTCVLGQPVHMSIDGQDNNIGYVNKHIESGWQGGAPYHAYTFHGQIDNFFYYNRAIDSTEVVNLWTDPCHLGISTSVNNSPIIHDNDVVVYPNPNNGSFTIITSAKTGTYQLYNMLGDIVNQGRLEEKVTLTDIPQGIYFLKVYCDGTVREKKVVVCQ